MNATEASRARWQRLVDAGLVDAPMPAPADVQAPWYVAALVGFAAWLAALFLMVFLAIAIGDFVKRPAGAIGVGAVVVAIAAFALRRSGERTFVSQLALAFSLAGQGLVLAGLLLAGVREIAASLAIFALVETALVVLVPHAAHRLLAAMAATASLAVASAWLGFDPVFLPVALAAFVAVQRGVLGVSRHEAALRPVAYGIAVAMLIAWGMSVELRGLLSGVGNAGYAQLPAIMPFALAAVCAAAGAVLARESGGARRTVVAAAFALAIVALAAKAVPAVAVALVILLFAYASSQHALFGIGAIGLVAALAHHYWRLDATLLAKSASLAVLGVTLAVGYVAVRRWPGRRALDAA